MKVYIVRQGVARGDERVESDSIVLPTLEEAREEYALADLSPAALGPYARALDEGWRPFCSIEEAEMLGEDGRPTDDPQAWALDGGRALVEERLG